MASLCSELRDGICKRVVEQLISVNVIESTLSTSRNSGTCANPGTAAADLDQPLAESGGPASGILLLSVSDKEVSNE
jgi:hypothetical protein